MYGIAALMCGPRLLCLARLDGLHLLQLAVGGAVPRSADGPPKVRPAHRAGDSHRSLTIDQSTFNLDIAHVMWMLT